MELLMHLSWLQYMYIYTYYYILYPGIYRLVDMNMYNSSQQQDTLLLYFTNFIH